MFGRVLLLLAGCLVFVPFSGADELSDAQRLALGALEIEFDIHATTGNEAELKEAFAEACKSGYHLACQRGAWVVYGAADLGTAAELFGSACEQGDPVACMVVGWDLDRSAHSSDRERRWRDAARLFRQHCDEGFGPACHEYGWLLYLNKGFTADPRAGVLRWKKACEAGDLPSCNTLGTLAIEGGTGVPRSSSSARKYLTQACDGSFSQACYMLGTLDEDGWDDAERESWFGGLCEEGHRESCWALAQGYLSGTHQPSSPDQIETLLNRGCELGSATSCFEAGRRAMAAETIDHATAGTFFARACDLGEIGGCTSQVELITQDLIEGAVKDSHTAFKTACLKRNSAAACTALAMELMRGVDLPRDPARARALLHRACIDADSSPKACYELGRSYSKGEGGDRDRTTGAKYFRYACDQGHMRACEDRGDLLNAGRGILRDDHDALAMYIRACNAGVAMACHKGAVILDEGTYVTANPAQATEMYQAACDYGSGEGCTGLGLMLEEDPDDDDDTNLIAAREAFERGIALGSISALREQARLLWNGVGGPKQRVRARRLASEACQKGDARACRGAEAL